MYHNHDYFKSAVAFFFLFFLHGFSIRNGQQGISYNGIWLCDRFAKRWIEQGANCRKTRVSGWAVY